MKILVLILSYVFLFSSHVRAEYEMHIPNCTQKGVENCGGFLFDNETGDVLFCGSESCADLKLPKSWKNKVSEKQSKLRIKVRLIAGHGSENSDHLSDNHEFF